MQISDGASPGRRPGIVRQDSRQDLMELTAARPPLQAPAASPFAGHGPGGVLVAAKQGLELPGRLSFEKWVRIGRQLSAVVSSSAWCLGDWLIYGETAYEGRYRDAIEQTALDYQTLRNYAWVARRFVMSRRRDGLSFGHHAEVAALPEPEQDFWLRKAEGQGWSRNRLRGEVRASLKEREVGPAVDGAAQPPQVTAEGEPGGEERGILVKVTPEQRDRCEQAARRERLTIEAWAAQSLDQVARRSLRGGQSC